MFFSYIMLASDIYTVTRLLQHSTFQCGCCPHPHTAFFSTPTPALSICLLTSKLFFGKIFWIFFWLVIIWTVHLNVWMTVQVRSLLEILCGVWTTTTTTVVVHTLWWCGNSLTVTKKYLSSSKSLKKLVKWQ